jgi:ATP-dependent RNA helicase DDX24/MAK5
VEEACVHCSEDGRDEALYYLLAAHPGRTLVFVNAVSAARRVAALLALLALPAAALHASMQQRARLRALDRFRSDADAVLVASDVAARGLDVTVRAPGLDPPGRTPCISAGAARGRRAARARPAAQGPGGARSASVTPAGRARAQGVRCVVHYQVPASADVYVHRCGRTARGEADGLAVALVTPREAPRYAALMHALGRGAPPDFPVDAALMPAVRRRVRLAVRLDEALRGRSKAAAEQGWRVRTAEAAGIELSDDEAAAPAGAPAETALQRARPRP